MIAARALRMAVLHSTPPPRPRRAIPPAVPFSQTPTRFYSLGARTTPPKPSTSPENDFDADDVDADTAGTEGRDEEQDKEMSAEKVFRRFLRQGPEKPSYGSAADFLRRIGKCLAFGCDETQTAEAARLAGIVAQDWADIQMGQGNAIIDPAAVHRDRIDRSKKDASWEPDSEVWGAIPRSFPVPAIAERAALKFLGYQLEVADPGIRAKWHQLQTRQRRAHNLGGHPAIRVVLVPPLTIRKINWPKYTRAVQNVSAYTRLESFEQVNDDYRFTLAVSIWSHRTNTLIAEAHVIMRLRPWQREKEMKWFVHEMGRLLNHESSGMVALYRNMNQALRRLETQTWDRTDAVEDFGSAA
ncbi:hypothetical protein CkaCkLH20_10440 [Colletotrichum karsti]|uniref:Uncharacterized protein n=1 Tax=Colletotrichum karsti TaxID=1095194 RepID=A0A9P6HWG6_9PEZI|nr:uncharacterized protein CkaCkLH20_10440 [Colletotrichum karsti]KAF9872103.1 hypothetical protein CkaCkLH20_10440 [Colletotrichum karsti]